MNQVFDVAVIGAGVVGAAIARELSKHQLDVALIEALPDVGMGTSKASTAIWHTGFDAKPGSLEATLMRRSYPLMAEYMREANIAHELLGAILIAWNPAQLEALPSLLQKAHQNGVTDVVPLTVEEIYKREPHINSGALGGLFVPGEGILCTYSVPLACAYQAVTNGVKLYLNWPVTAAKREQDAWVLETSGAGAANQATRSIRTRFVVNAAGLESDTINNLFGHQQFKVTPRRGQLIIYDKLARSLVNHVLLPVPTSVTKGVLISPTVYGNILLGPTAEDLKDKSASQTTTDGLNMLIDKGRMILPQLLDEEVTATYSGMRAATEHSDYQIQMHADQNYLCAGGIRSTGISSALGIAEYAAELLAEAGLSLKPKDEFKTVRLPSIGHADQRPFQDAALLAKDGSYGQIVCHCELVSRGEVRDAMCAPIPATTLDGIRRRTRASQGRCQGFNCHAALTAALGGTSSSTANVCVMPTVSAAAATTRNVHAKSVSISTQVLIVGGGPAGLAAAIELKKQGVKDVVVVDREAEAGGTPRLCHHIGFGREDLWRLYSGPGYAKRYRQLALDLNVDIRTSTTVTGWSSAQSDFRLNVSSPSGIGEISAGTVLLATGIRERPRSARMIPGSRPSGVFTTGSLQRFLHEEHLPVGKTAVIVGAELVSLSALMMLWESGVRCAMMVTDQPRHQVYFPFTPMKWALTKLLTQTPVVTGARITNVLGQRKLEGIEVTRASGQVQSVPCDALIFTGEWIPENEMARQAGLVIDAASRGPLVDAGYRTSTQGIFAAGNLLRGVATADRCAIEGTQVGRSIAAHLRKDAWPQERIAIKCHAPLSWICPGAWTAGDEPSVLQFTSNEFRSNVTLRVTQGSRTLHTQAMRSLIVNEMMTLPGRWMNDVDPRGGAIEIKVG
jgi:L-2-hydroxyglutarate oxidase LhgO